MVYAFKYVHKDFIPCYDFHSHPKVLVSSVTCSSTRELLEYFHTYYSDYVLLTIIL